jgi:hypothetical protein
MKLICNRITVSIFIIFANAIIIPSFAQTNLTSTTDSIAKPKKEKKRKIAVNNTFLFTNLGVGFHGPAYQSGWKPSIHASADLRVYKGLKLGIAGNFFHYTITDINKFNSGSLGLNK